MLLAPNDLQFHRPFRIGEGPSPLGPRLGGAAPDLPGLHGLLSSPASYVLTVPLSRSPAGDLYASVFVSSDRASLIRARNRGFHSDNRIFAVSHLDAGRSLSSEYASALSSHPLILLPEQPDSVEDGEGGTVYSSVHKLGGWPYCLQEPELPGARELYVKGYRQVLQLDVPGAEDGRVRGNWPFFGGLLNLFWKEPWNSAELQWYLQG